MFLTKDNFFEILEGNRKLTMRIVEAFPDEQLFSYTPDEKMRSFFLMVKEILNIEKAYMKGIALDEWEYKDAFENVSTKEDLVRKCNEIREETRKLWAEMDEDRLLIVIKDPFFGGESSHFSRLQYGLENEIHHRGQGYTYLRMLGIEPPAFYER